MSYEGLLITGLCLAALANGYQAKGLLLVFISALFLILLPSQLPDSNDLQGYWYVMLFLLDGLFLGSAIMLEAPQSKPVAAFSAWNMIGHIIGLLSFQYDWNTYFIYPVIIRAGEICQIISLLLFSDPIIRLAAEVNLAIKERRDDHQHRLATAS